jgi:hypothetical protein
MYYRGKLQEDKIGTLRRKSAQPASLRPTLVDSSPVQTVTQFKMSWLISPLKGY